MLAKGPQAYQPQGAPIAPLFIENQRRGILANPYSADRILIRQDRGEEPFRFQVGKVGNTLCSGTT